MKHVSECLGDLSPFRLRARPFLVGLTGPGGCGKSTVAAEVARIAPNFGWLAPRRLHLGAPLKAMLGAFYDHAGLGPALTARRLDGDLKRAPCPYLGGKTPTEAMQALGTEWGRRAIYPGLWLDLWRSSASAALDDGFPVIQESVRFEDEAAAIRSLGGVVVRLTGRDGDLAPDHISEAGVVADLEVPNTGPPERAAGLILSLLIGGGISRP